MQISGVLCCVGRNSLLHNEHVLSLWTTISTILVKFFVIIVVTILMILTLVKLVIFGDSVDYT